MDGNTGGKSNRSEQAGHDHGRPGKSRKAEKSEVPVLETTTEDSGSVEEAEKVEENQGKSRNDRPKRGRRSASRPAGQPVFGAEVDLTV
jgi:hypothetical protein